MYIQLHRLSKTPIFMLSYLSLLSSFLSHLSFFFHWRQNIDGGNKSCFILLKKYYVFLQLQLKRIGRRKTRNHHQALRIIQQRPAICELTETTQRSKTGRQKLLLFNFKVVFCAKDNFFTVHSAFDNEIKVNSPILNPLNNTNLDLGSTASFLRAPRLHIITINVYISSYTFS